MENITEREELLDKAYELISRMTAEQLDRAMELMEAWKANPDEQK
jgi:hypothetical protein